MAIFATKHDKREHDFFIRSFNEGLVEDASPESLPINALTQCYNMKYVYDQSTSDSEGKTRTSVILKIRQGTTKISGQALPSSAPVLACTYYIAGSKYILATASKLYYLDGSYIPVEIGSISGVPTFTEFHGKLIIHDSGTTKAWDGTTLETLNCLYQDESLGTGDGVTTAYAGTVTNPAIASATLEITYTSSGVAKTITSAASGALSGDVAASELMPNQVDRDFSGASAWANVDLNAYDETGNLTITANAANQYCTCPVLSAPTTIGKVYRMTFTVANLVATWTIKSFDGTQTIGTVTAAGAQSFVWTATTTGGYRIVAVGATSSGDFDDFTLSGNAVNYTTGVYQFTASGAPDNTTPIYAEYEKSSGAPKSKAGFVRASRLYMWGDSDNPSRLWYSGPNDEDAWDTSSNGGYLDCDPLDGYDLVSCVNMFDAVVLIKENSLHRLDNFPGDNTFEIVPLLKEVGGIAYKTCLSAGGIISFLSKEGWIGLTSTEGFGDISKTHIFSKNFKNTVALYSNSSAYAEYNQIDRQLWLTLYNGATQLTYAYVISMDTGGQASIYQFVSTHRCYKFVNNEMLIGSAAGELFRLNTTDAACLDGVSSYATNTYVRGVMADWGITEHRKHNKTVNLHIYGTAEVTGTLELYKNKNYRDTIYSASVSSQTTSTIKFRRKFNYQEVMFRLTNIYGGSGAEFSGIDFTSAIIGR